MFFLLGRFILHIKCTCKMIIIVMSVLTILQMLAVDYVLINENKGEQDQANRKKTNILIHFDNIHTCT